MSKKINYENVNFGECKKDIHTDVCHNTKFGNSLFGTNLLFGDKNAKKNCEISCHNLNKSSSKYYEGSNKCLCFSDINKKVNVKDFIIKNTNDYSDNKNESCKVLIGPKKPNTPEFYRKCDQDIYPEGTDINDTYSKKMTCAQYDFKNCSFPNRCEYYEDDGGNNKDKDIETIFKDGTKKIYNNYNVDMITKKLEKIKDDDELLHGNRCACDYWISYYTSLSPEDGGSDGKSILWNTFKDKGYEAAYDYLVEQIVGNNYTKPTKEQKQIIYQILKLMCEALNTVNPREKGKPKKSHNPKKYFQDIFINKTFLTIFNILLKIFCVYILLHSYYKYANRILPLLFFGKSMGKFIFPVMIMIWGLLFGIFFYAGNIKYNEKFPYIIIFPLVTVLILSKITNKNIKFLKMITAALFLSQIISFNFMIATFEGGSFAEFMALLVGRFFSSLVFTQKAFIGTIFYNFKRSWIIPFITFASYLVQKSYESSNIPFNISTYSLGASNSEIFDLNFGRNIRLYGLGLFVLFGGLGAIISI